jgi:hypothetical protein
MVQERAEPRTSGLWMRLDGAGFVQFLRVPRAAFYVGVVLFPLKSRVEEKKVMEGEKGNKIKTKIEKKKGEDKKKKKKTSLCTTI